VSNLYDKLEGFIRQCDMGFKVSPLQKMFTRDKERQAAASAVNREAHAPSFPLRPSSAASCSRKLYYQLSEYFEPSKRVIEPFNIRSNRVFAYGHQIERFELKQIEDTHALSVQYKQEYLEIAKIKGMSIVGSLDAVIWVKRKKQPYLCDVKSINTYGFARIEQSTFPKVDNIVQLNMYLCSPGFKALMEKHDIDHMKVKGLLVYCDKNSQAFEWIEFLPSQELFDATIQRFERIYESYKEGTPPCRDFVMRGRTSFPCGYCQYRETLCQGQPDPDKKLEVGFDLNLDAEEEDIIHTLWHRCGESSTYVYKDKLLEVEQLKTKWKLKIKNGFKQKKTRKDNTEVAGLPVPNKGRNARASKKATRKSGAHKNNAAARDSVRKR